ncbi:MAG: hypothetical protein QMD03_08330 [Syntrophales bacterium]|nr:hypothetical protein [Syntrophales bacterium]
MDKKIVNYRDKVKKEKRGIMENRGKHLSKTILYNTLKFSPILSFSPFPLLLKHIFQLITEGLHIFPDFFILEKTIKKIKGKREKCDFSDLRRQKTDSKSC